MKVLRLFALAALLCSQKAAVTQTKPSTETPAGKCFTVHGRYSIFVDGDGIWIIGTHRLLNAVSDELDHMIQGKGDDYDHSIYGDFTVCPVTKYQKGHKQVVNIQSYKNIRIGSYR